MTCDEVAKSEVVEKYLLGGLTDPVRDAFEQHYFECERCFGELQTHRAIRAELARTATAIRAEASRPSLVWRWAWAPALAVAVIAVSIAYWPRPSVSEFEPRPAEQTVPSAPAPPGEQPKTPPRAPTSPTAPSLEELARVEPPRYVASRLRAAPDEAAARFQAAMKHYERGDYRDAIAGLQAAARLDPEAPYIGFFLGASHLLNGDPDAAIRTLRQAVALGESAYLEDAHFYLAKAHVQKRNVDAAVQELRRTVRLRGDREREALDLLRQLELIQSQR